MKKTIAVNISGVIFNIEEDAYEKLKKYLSTIKGYFHSSESGDEIIDDVESRIAELFQERINPAKGAITEGDVSEVIAIMGEPEAYIEDEENQDYAQSTASKSSSRRENNADRELFRDKDNGILAGVCSGLAAYFSIDTVWVRLAFVLAFMFYSVGFWPYIILWIIIPVAKTAADKLRMHGDPVNIDSIKKKVNEGFERVKYEAENFDSAKHTAGFASAISKIVDLLARVLKVVVGFLASIIGFVFLMIGVAFIVAIVMNYIDPSRLYMNSGFPFGTDGIIDHVFESSLDANILSFGLLLLAGIPILALVLIGIRLLFNLRLPYRGVGLSLLTAWFVGLFVTIFASINLGNEFQYKDEISSSFDLNIPSDTLQIQLTEEPDLDGVIQWNGMSVSPSRYGMILLNNVSLDIVSVPSDQEFALKIIKSAHGGDYEELESTINSIAIDYELLDNTLKISPRLSYPIDDKFRVQEVDYVLYVPIGKSVFMMDKLHAIIDDIDKKTNRSTRAMMNNYWIMTSEGFAQEDHSFELPEKVSISIDIQ